jgi:hypothetical protein
MPRKAAKPYKRPSKLYSKKQILNSKTPDDYVERTLNSELSRGEKIAIAREWQIKSGFTGKDIKEARQRHPFWKEKKREGSAQRIAERIKQHNYSKVEGSRTREYSNEEIDVFLELNQKDRSGKYVKRDWEIAKQMRTTIPAIQHWRRKYNLISKIADVENKKLTKKYVMKMMDVHEKGLRRMYKEMI